MGCTSFEEKLDPSVVELQIKDIKKILGILGILMEYGVSFVSFMFLGATPHWWDTIGYFHDTSSIMWVQFDYIFRKTQVNAKHWIAKTKE